MTGPAIGALKALDKEWRSKAVQLDIAGKHREAAMYRERSDELWAAMHATEPA